MTIPCDYSPTLTLSSTNQHHGQIIDQAVGGESSQGPSHPALWAATHLPMIENTLALHFVITTQAESLCRFCSLPD